MGRPPHIDEVFKQTHVRKDSGEFVDERSKRTHVSILSLCYLFYSNINCIYDLIYIFE